MSIDLSGYGENLEESKKKLIELGSILDRTEEVLQKASGDLRAIETRQESGNQTFQENAIGLLEALSEFGSNTEARLDDLNRVMEGLQSSVDTSNSKISSAFEMVSSLISTTQQELSEEKDTLTTALNELSEIISHFVDDANTSIERTNSEIALFTEGNSQLSEKVYEAKENLSVLTDKVSTLFDELTNAFLDSLKSSLESIHITVLSALAEAQNVSIEEALANVSSQLEDLLVDYADSCTTVGEELMDNVSKILEDCTLDISDNIEKKLSEAFEDASENMLRVILEELGTTVATMVAGSSVSGVMMPLVPALKTVGTALEALNNTLDYFE